MNNSRRNFLLASALGAAILALGACSRYSAPAQPVYKAPPAPDLAAPPSSEFYNADARRFRTAQAQTETTGAGDKAVPVKRIAVSHAFTLHLPDTDVEAVRQRHLAECTKLGCTVVSTTLDRSYTRRVIAQSEVRIAPDAFAAFADILAAPPARIVKHSETANDETVPMLDVEKRLEVKMALRDRLTAMLQEPGAKELADLLTIEKELAQVQGEIETAVAQRDYLRTITETVHVEIRYDGLAAQAAGLDLSPISMAGKNIGSTLVYSAAALISFLAAILPWLPLIALVAWGVRRALQRWRRARSAAA
jgi:hypothetical protein